MTIEELTNEEILDLYVHSILSSDDIYSGELLEEILDRMGGEGV